MEFEKDKQLQAFINQYINGFISYNLINHIARNPQLLDSAKSIANALGRDLEPVKKELKRFVNLKVLIFENDLYRYEPSPEVEEKISTFMVKTKDRSYRLKLCAWILEKEASKKKD